MDLHTRGGSGGALVEPAGPQTANCCRSLGLTATLLAEQSERMAMDR